MTGLLPAMHTHHSEIFFFNAYPNGFIWSNLLIACLGLHTLLCVIVSFLIHHGKGDYFGISHSHITNTTTVLALWVLVLLTLSIAHPTLLLLSSPIFRYTLTRCWYSSIFLVHFSVLQQFYYVGYRLHNKLVMWVPSTLTTLFTRLPIFSMYTGTMYLSSGDRIRTCDLWDMSPASFLAALLRVNFFQRNLGGSPHTQLICPIITTCSICLVLPTFLAISNCTALIYCTNLANFMS